MLLEISYEALENGAHSSESSPSLQKVKANMTFCPLAGIRKEDIDGSDAAVYVGSFVKGKQAPHILPSRRC